MNPFWLVGAFVFGVALGMSSARLRALARDRSRVLSPPAEGPEVVSARLLVPIGEVLADPLLVLDAEDRLVFANEAARNRFGFDREATGADAAILVRSADFIERLRGARAMMSAGVCFAGEEIVVRRGPRDGEMIYLMTVAALPAEVGFGSGCLAILLADRTKLRHLEKLRREFVANVSHDLRTPVTILKGYAVTLSEDFPTMDDDDRRRFLEKIRRNVDRLHALLESMVELASADDGGALCLRPGVLNATLRDAADLMAERLAGRGLTVELSCVADDSLVEVDPMRFLRIIINLLENVLRYASGARRVGVSTSCDADGFHVRIEDDGPGLASAGDYERVFERFFRVEKSRSLAGGGSGLGLAIVKNMVISHGGAVRAEPVAPHGFAVIITLPRVAAPPA